MKVTIQPGCAAGSVNAPPSKSMAHRYLIGAALANGESEIRNISPSQDILATTDALCAFGARIRLDETTAHITGVRAGKKPSAPLGCRECGTTLRLLLPLCLIGGEKAILTGSKKLLSRPLAAYEELCRSKGFTFEKKETEVHVAGILKAGIYEMPGNVSSQYISGLLYALSCVKGDSRIVLTTNVESRSYIDLTLQAMARFGAVATWENAQMLYVHGGQTYEPRTVTVEGDWSNAAFWLALRTLGDAVTVNGLDDADLQGDRICTAYFDAMREGCPTLSLADCPDLAPILIVTAALLHGATLTDTARLRLKESDRGEAMRIELAKCGIHLVVEENRIVVPAATPHAPTETLFGHQDHRIVMALAVLLTRIGGSIEGAEAVDKSYPTFFGELKKLGIEMQL